MGFESPPEELVAGRRRLFADRTSDQAVGDAASDVARELVDGDAGSNDADWTRDSAPDRRRTDRTAALVDGGEIADDAPRARRRSTVVVDDDYYDDEEDSGVLRWLAFGLLLLAVVGTVLGLRFLTSGGGDNNEVADVSEEGPQGLEPGFGVDQGRTSVPDGQTDADGGQTARFVAPLEIFPQRAKAGAPTTLSAQGSGCAPQRSGLLSIREIGTGLDGASEDLVLRRGFPVDDFGIWRVQPVLAPMTPGSYRVTASCFRASDPESGQRRTSGGDGLGDLEELLTRGTDSRLLEASEVLVLTGPAVLPAVRISPEQAQAGTSVTISVQGSGCLPGGVVTGEVFVNDGSEATRQIVKTFSGFAGQGGDWVVQVGLDADAGARSYSVAANCAGGTDYATGTVTFVPDEIARIGTTPAASRALPLTPSAQAIEAQPNYTD